MLKEVLKSLGKRSETIKYPVGSSPAEKGFRGKLKYDPEKCVASGHCIKVCPVIALRFKKDENFKHSVISIDHGRCIRCSNCVEACPTKALTFTEEYETSTDDAKKLIE